MPLRSHYGTGWLPEEPDTRDYSPFQKNVQPLLAKAGIIKHIERKKKLPAAVDLRKYCSPVVFQGGYNTCTPHVVTGLIEFLEKRIGGAEIIASRLFLYKTTKNLLNESGDKAVYIRESMGALVLLGAPPEKYWPYLKTGTPSKPLNNDPRINLEPPAFCYATARNYRGLKYYRLDPGGQQSAAVADETLWQLKVHLAASLPVGFGFPLYASLAQATRTGRIPFPAPNEKQIGNHAVLAVGYDDNLVIQNTNPGGTSTKGALLFKNSWSTLWGEAGYGWLPYDFVLSGSARAFWTLTQADWIATDRFQL